MSDIPEGFVDVSEAQDGGVLKKIVTEGKGTEKPSQGSEVTVHYVGTLYGGEKDGEQFDSSRDRGDFFKFKLGEGQVIKAWDQGVASMKQGELSEIICKPSYAYGEGGQGSIPPNSTLKFEVELFSWAGKDISPNNDKGITMLTTTKGTGYETPKDCANVTLDVEGTLDGAVFDKRENISWELSDEDSVLLPEGVYHGIKKMKKGEEAVFEIQSQFGWGAKGNAEFKIPGGATIKYKLNLRDFEKLKESWSVDKVEDKFEQTEEFKKRGTDKLQKGKFTMAEKFYAQALTYLSNAEDFKKEAANEERMKKLKVALYLNSALCFLKLGDTEKCIEKCDEAIKIEAKSEKAHFRRGQAYVTKNDFELAEACFREVLAIDATNKAAANLLRECKLKLKDVRQKEKSMYQSIFSKMAAQAQLRPDSPPKASAGDEEKSDSGSVSSEGIVEKEEGVPA